jgi:hypothetical protein
MFTDFLLSADLASGREVRLAHRIEERNIARRTRRERRVLVIDGIIGLFVAAMGLYDSAQGLPWYLFSEDSYGPRGQENLGQGLPRISQENVFSPEAEGAPRRECHIHDRKAGLAAWYDPFRADPVGKLAQNKPWAKSKSPFGPQTS